MNRIRTMLVLTLLLLVEACKQRPYAPPNPPTPQPSSPAGSSQFLAKNAIVLVIDGPRQTEMWADPQRSHIPQMSSKLAPEGVLMSGFRNNGPTYTNSGHTALTTGVYEEMENRVGSQLPSYAGMFQHFLRTTGLPPAKAWVVTSKDKLAMLGDTSQPGWAGQWRPSVWSGRGGQGLGSGYSPDSDTIAAVKTILNREHPRLMLINLREPDYSGHGGDWNGYLRGIEASDAHAAELWYFLQDDPEYRGRTAYFITHDHGRHLDGVGQGFQNHGDNCEGCRRIALLAIGPDFRQGAVVPTGGEQIDLPVTIGYLLGFQLPGVHGRVLKELFK